MKAAAGQRPASMKLGEIAAMLGGKMSGDPDREIVGVAGIIEAREGDITFLSDKRLARECSGSKASAVVVRDFIPNLDKPQIAVRNPQYAFARLLEHFYARPVSPAGVSGLAFVSESARIAGDVSVYPLAYISDDAVIGTGTVIYPGVFIGNGTVIGENCILYPNVSVREGVLIGSRVIIHPGTVIGADGFGYVFEEGRHYKIPQVGGVVIEDDVEIGANVTVDRATTGNTVVGKGTKIDNLVQIAHNVHIGRNVILCGQVGVSGSTTISDGVVLGGQVGVADHASIEAGVMIGAQSGVFGQVKPGVYSGYPAIPHRDWLRSSAIFAKLPELSRKIKQLEEKIEVLERGRP